MFSEVWGAAADAVHPWAAMDSTDYEEETSEVQRLISLTTRAYTRSRLLLLLAELQLVRAFDA